MTNNPDQNVPPAVPEYPPAPEPAAAPYPYAAQPGQQPVGQSTNVLAIISLVASIIGFALVGVITGHIALGQIKRTGAPGHGVALAGVIIGYIYIGASLLFLVIWGVIALVIAGSPSANTY